MIHSMRPLTPRVSFGRAPHPVSAQPRRLTPARALADASATLPRVPFLRSNALDAAYARRGFGLEIEFELLKLAGKRRAIERIGQSLFDAGLVESPVRQPPHQNRGSPLWHYEKDGTVSGGEIVSPVLRDSKKTWADLERALKVIVENGGELSLKTGGHIHVGVGDFGRSPAKYVALANLFEVFQDELFHLATNPETGVHRSASRSTEWSARLRAPVETYKTFTDVLARNSSKYAALTFRAARGGPNGHVEFRLWDGALDPGVIQARVKLSLALTQLAAAPERAHRLVQRALDAAPSERMPMLLDALFTRPEDLRQVAALYAQVRAARPS